MKHAIKSLSLLLAACCLLCIVPAHAAEIVASGFCDKDFKNVTWTLDADYVLTISGKGEMEYFPWRSLYFGKITAVKINNGVTNVHDSAFYECSKMATLSLPDSLTSIERAAFYDCKSLTQVSVPHSVTSIGDSAFAHCWNLKTIMLPIGLTEIPNNLFYECMCLSELTVPSSVTRIGDRAFCKCYELKSITIPKSVKTIGTNAFDLCVDLKDVYYEGSEAQWKAITVKDGNKYLTGAKIHYNQKIEPPAHEHKWDAGKVTKAPTCAATGVKTFTCSVCKATKTQTLAKTSDHKWDKGSFTAPDRKNLTAIKTYTCSVCKKTKTEKTKYLPGDVDGNGKPEAADARLALRRAVGLETFAKNSPQFLACDVNRDGSVTADDPRLILRASVGLEDPKTWR